MVVVTANSFGKVDSHPGSNNHNDTKSSPNKDAPFSVCDTRGMLHLNQDLVINKGNITELYRMDKGAPFATGLYAQVKRCKSLLNSTFYAAKFCPRKRPGQGSDEECIENLHEIALLSQLQHPYIISFIDAFILQDCVVTIMELAPGGDLQTVIDADLVLLEKDAARYIFQLLEALKYLHERHIAHLDIKPQNLLLMGEFPTCDIKLCDFEISRVIKPGKEVKEILGTPDYVAPEILLYEPLSTSADMWSVGILCYVLLTGFSPFGGDTDQETFRNIVHEPIDFPAELFEDISQSAIDFIVKLAEKNAKLRPTPIEMENHDWIQSFIQYILPQPSTEPEPQPESPQSHSPEAESILEQDPEIAQALALINQHTGPKKRSPRKTMAMSGLSTASVQAAGRRPSARSILRACKSAYDLNKMGGKTKSREALIEKMKASGYNSVGGNWKLRKNLSKSREQLWESKIQLSKSCEKINQNFHSARWASVANFPSLDQNGLKASTSQESVISVVSSCTNPALLDLDQAEDPGVLSPPILPHFDLSSPISSMVGPSIASAPVTSSDFNFPSLLPLNRNVGDSLIDSSSSPPDESSSATSTSSTSCPSAESAAADAESQKSVAELILTFGGRPNGPNPPSPAGVNNKKLDLKNQFEPILEVEGGEEQPISFGDYNYTSSSTSGVSSIMGGSNNKEQRESGHFSMNSSSSSEADQNQNGVIGNCTGGNNNNSKPRSRSYPYDTSNNKTSSPRNYRRGSVAPPKLGGNIGVSSCHTSTSTTPGLKGILKKPNNLLTSSNFENGGLSHLRRGSIPGNCTRLYDTHTISSLAKVPKKSILKNGSNAANNSKNAATESGRKQSRTPEAEPEGTGTDKIPEKPPSAAKSKPIPKGLSPRERPSFILLNDQDEKPKVRRPAPSFKPSSNATTSTTRRPGPTSSTTSSRNRAKVPVKPVAPPTPKPPPKPRPSIREQIIKSKRNQPPGSKGGNNVTVQILQKPRKGQPPEKLPTPPTTPTSTDEPKSLTFPNGNTHNPPTPPSPSSPLKEKFKSELVIEPAAVAIKIFPPDPVIVPKSPSKANSSNSVEDSNNNSNNEDNNNNSNNKLSSGSDSLGVLANNHVNVNVVPKSPESRRKLKEKEKSTWGVVCTGSIGRAMERFESGSVRGKKLRRGSVPDF